MRKTVLLILLLGVLPATGVPVPAYKFDTIGACTTTEVSDAEKKVLQDYGLRVNGDSGPFCEIWLRSVLPQSNGTGTGYSTLAAGTFVGVIHYFSNGGDYRGRAIKPGFYTLRYQTMPSDGNHMGVAPTPDFFVLLPPAADKDPSAVLEYEDVIKLGKQASGTNHLYPLFLTSPTDGTFPDFKAVDESHWAIEAKIKAQPKAGAETDFPIALVLIGKSDSN